VVSAASDFGGEGTIKGRHFAAGPKIPWYLTRFALGAGTSAASFSMNSDASKITWVVPLRHGVFNRYVSRPSGSQAKRSIATGGRAA
jgi:hypothetical protein